MAEQPPAITQAHYPAVMLSVVNPIVRLLLRTPFKGAARKQLMVLSFPDESREGSIQSHLVPTGSTMISMR